MQLLVLIGGGVVVGVATVFAMDWFDRVVASRRATKAAAEGTSDGGFGPLGPADGVPHLEDKT